MLSENSIKNFAAEFHTSELNIMREYLQHVLLSHLYQHLKSDALAFKGGTALRVLFGSPRFSEDLDFSSNLTAYHIRNILVETLDKVKREAFIWTLDESKTTSGGYFSRYIFDLYKRNISIEFNISLRDLVKPEPILVTTPLFPAYQCMVLPIRRLVWEKIDALFRRKKPRDFFDLYFFLRERRGVEEIITFKKRIIKVVEALDAQSIKKELRLLLPVTHHAILKDFPKVILAELSRF